MTITSDPYVFRQFGQWTHVTVTSSLTNPTIFWYLDGTFYDRTETLDVSVFLAVGDQADIVAVDTTDPDNFDVVANAPTAGPARRTLWWVRSTDSDVAYYSVQQQREAEGLVEVGRVAATDDWDYRFVTPRLDDLTNYDWEIVPYDSAQNPGTALALDQVLIVRRPDSPDFTVAFDGGTTRVTFAAA